MKRPNFFAALGFLAVGLAVGSLLLVLHNQRAAAPPHQTSRPNGFDISNAIIPAHEILSGGPSRDGIPSIDKPRFIRPQAAASFMRDDDLVISVSLGAVTRAYPLRILVWHEIVNDDITGQPIAVTYCPLCGTAMVFNRRVGDQTLSFGVSGLLYHSDVLMYDRQTESLWSQIGMKAVSGPFVNTPLEWLPSVHMTWNAWREKFPKGEVLSQHTGLARDYQNSPYAGYEQHPGTIFPVPAYRVELPRKAWVLGVLIGGEAKAYPVESLALNHSITDLVGGIKVAVSYDPQARSATVHDAESGELLPSVLAFWFAWQAFYPDTSIWQP